MEYQCLALHLWQPKGPLMKEWEEMVSHFTLFSGEQAASGHYIIINLY